jgi:hypothetical protein
MHQNVAPLNYMLNKFNFKKNEKFDETDVNTLKSLEKRYYKPMMSTKGKLSSLLREKVIETANLRKHDKVRRDP